jgi:DNA-binding MarR family transcriptional regulator
MRTREELVEEWFASFQALQKAWKHQFHKMLGEENLSMTQIGILFYVREHQSITGSELALHLQISRSAVTQIIDKLADAGYVSRREDQADRRVTHLCLSPAGEDKLKALEQKRKEFFISTSYSLTDEELVSMRLVQNKIIEQIENQ